MYIVVLIEQLHVLLSLSMSTCFCFYKFCQIHVYAVRFCSQIHEFLLGFCPSVHGLTKRPLQQRLLASIQETHKYLLVTTVM